MTGRTVKLPGWKPQQPPTDETEKEKYRDLIVEAVTMLYSTNRLLYAKMGFPPQPISLREIYRAVQNKIDALKRIRKWKYKSHGKRWVDRRVNEAACPECGARIVAATAGYYQPTLKMFASVMLGYNQCLEITPREGIIMWNPEKDLVMDAAKKFYLLKAYGEKLMIVDDDNIIRQYSLKQLQEKGFIWSYRFVKKRW